MKIELEFAMWQEMDCPDWGNDWDLCGDEMVYAGQVFKCPNCGNQHIADSSYIVTFTKYFTGDYGLVTRPLPSSAVELRHLRETFDKPEVPKQSNSEGA